MPLGIDRRLVYNVDWVLVASALVLSILGVAMIYSATHTGSSPDLYLKQLALVGAGVVGLGAAAALSRSVGIWLNPLASKEPGAFGWRMRMSIRRLAARPSGVSLPATGRCSP